MHFCEIVNILKETTVKIKSQLLKNIFVRSEINEIASV